MAAKAYNAGNRLLEQGDVLGAIREYDTALGLSPNFARAYYNRALANSRAGDERTAVADLKSAAVAGFDEDFFYDAWVRHQRSIGGYASVVSLCDALDIPARQRHRLEAQLVLHLRREHFLLTDAPQAGMEFALESLPLRCDIADLLETPVDPNPVPVDRILGRLAEGIADAEAEWRARYLLATLYGSEVLHPLEAIQSRVGLFWDETQMETAFVMSRDEETRAGFDSVLCRHDQRWRPLDRESRFARFALAQLEASAEVLVADRRFRLVSRRASFEQWEVVEDLWRAAVELSLHLGDDAAYGRSVGRARRFGALVDAWRWFDSAHRLPKWDPAAVGRRLDVLAPTAVEPAAPSDPRTLVLDYFVYEKATDTVAWHALGTTASQLGSSQIDPDLVEDLLKIALQWEHPEAIAVELNRSQNELTAAQIRPLIWRMILAEAEIPAEDYPATLDEAILGGVRDQLADTERLVIVPWGYLHNVPFHLLRSVRTAVGSGRLRETLYSPAGMLAAPLPTAIPLDRRTARVMFVGVGAGLPSLGTEAELIHGLYPAAVRLVDQDATPERVLEELTGCDVVHFACHGGFDRHADAAFLQLHGGRLYTADLLSSPGPMPQLAFLNACVTGVTGRGGRNSDARLGLPHALLAAGTAEVIGAMWEIDDAAALEFASRFFRRWSADEWATTGAIVQHVQTEMRRLPRFSHMALWGAHAVWASASSFEKGVRERQLRQLNP